MENTIYKNSMSNIQVTINDDWYDVTALNYKNFHHN